MACFCLIIIFCQSIICLVAGTCENQTRQQVIALANGAYPSCRDVDLATELLICQRDEHDEGDTCGPADPPVEPPCPGETWERVCYPEMTPGLPLNWTCVCHSPATGDARATYWSGWEALVPPVGDAHFTRRLVMEGGECITREYSLVWRAVVAGYNLPDSVFFASDKQAASYPAYKARVDDFWDDSGCAWVPPRNTIPYLLITLTTPYKIIGIYFNRGCSSLYPAVVSITTSDDENTWEDIAVQVNLVPLYVDESAFVWFTPQVYTTRYWIITIYSGNGDYPRFKCDLITNPVWDVHLHSSVKIESEDQVNPLAVGIFTHLKLCLADAIHNIKWVKMIQFEKMEVNCFQILRIDVTFYL